MTQQDDGSKSIEGQQPIGEQPTERRELPINEHCAQIVYDECGRQNERVMTALDELERLDLEHTEAYESLVQRGAAFRQMRGVLQDAVDSNLRSASDE
jgi:hypothetical protein